MLDLEHPALKRFRIIVGPDAHDALRDDRTGVDVARDEMHGRAVQPDARRKRSAVRPEARERRQKRRMDVEQAAREMFDESAGQDAHEAREHDQVRPVGIDRVRERHVECIAPLEVEMRQNLCRNAEFGGDLQSRDIGAAADHGGNTQSERPLPIFRARGCKKRPQVAAPPRNQNDDVLHRERFYGRAALPRADGAESTSEIKVFHPRFV